MWWFKLLFMAQSFFSIILKKIRIQSHPQHHILEFFRSLTKSSRSLSYLCYDFFMCGGLKGTKVILKGMHACFKGCLVLCDQVFEFLLTYIYIYICMYVCMYVCMYL